MRKYALEIGALGICIISLIISLFVYNKIANSETINNTKIINHELRLTKDGAGDYMITSVPQELRDSQEFDIRNRLGTISSVFICRADGKWDSEPFIVSRSYSHNHPIIKNAIKRLQLLMDICDKALPDEKMVSIGYYADYNELIIYLDPDLWKNKTHHEEIIKKLNDGLLGEMV